MSKSLLGVSLWTEITFRILFWIFFFYFCRIWWFFFALLLPNSYASFSTFLRRWQPALTSNISERREVMGMSQLFPMCEEDVLSLNKSSPLSHTSAEGGAELLKACFIWSPALTFSFCPSCFGWQRKATVGIMREVSSLLCSWKKTA